MGTIAAARFSIGSTNIISYILEDGLTFEYFDIDAPDAGRTLDGKMHRARVAQKVKITVRCRPLTAAQLSSIQNLMTGQTFTVRYYNPAGTQVSKTMYKGDERYDAHLIVDSTTGEYHNYEFHLIEV